MQCFACLAKVIVLIAEYCPEPVTSRPRCSVSEGPKFVVGSVDNLQHQQLFGALRVAWRHRGPLSLEPRRNYINPSALQCTG